LPGFLLHPVEATPDILGNHSSAVGRASAGLTADGPSGHRSATSPWDFGTGLHAIPSHVPTNGMHIAPPKSTIPQITPAPNPTPNLGRLPKLTFPRFNGDNTCSWRTLAEDYFAMYGVESSMWICVSRQHFDGPAKSWIHSIESQLPGCSWDEFCRLLRDRFDRDQHEILIRQLFFH
jgi:hypothetical protein